jgi:carboxyl-terminal processing protease
VEPGSAAERAGIRAGDVIESVNGKPALSLITQRLNEAISVRLSSRYRAFATVMEGPLETPVELGWRRKDGKEKASQFRRYWQQRELKFRLRKVRGEYAVLEIDAFTKPIASDFVRALKEKTRGAHGLILDLRSNGGGDAEAMTEIASFLLGAGFDLGQFTDRSGNSFPISTRSKSLFMPEGIGQTNLPLIVLTSERTSSAAEILTAALKTFKRATIIGTETCGCVLAIRTRHLLPDGGLLDVSELDYQTAAGERLERNSVQPDETVVVQRNDLYSGSDRALDLAIDRLANLRIAQSEKVSSK